jgi:hypothetical protein
MSSLPESKTKIISLRFKPSELATIDAQAKAVNLSRSVYIARKLTGLSVLPTVVPPINWKLYGELAEVAADLAALGNNINQIAKTCHVARLRGEAISSCLPESESLATVVESIEETKKLLKQVRLALAGVKRGER